MKKFIVLYTSQMSPEEAMKMGTPEQQKAGMEMWMAWAKKNGSAIVDLGNPLINAHSVDKKGASKMKSSFAGYSIMQGENMDAVAALFTDHPHFMVPGNGIEMHEVMPMM